MTCCWWRLTPPEDRDCSKRRAVGGVVEDTAGTRRLAGDEGEDEPGRSLDFTSRKSLRDKVGRTMAPGAVESRRPSRASYQRRDRHQLRLLARALMVFPQVVGVVAHEIRFAPFHSACAAPIRRVASRQISPSFLSSRERESRRWASPLVASSTARSSLP